MSRCSITPATACRSATSIIWFRFRQSGEGSRCRFPDGRCQLVLRQMEGSGTKLNLVILDACRNNPFGGRGLRDRERACANPRRPRERCCPTPPNPATSRSTAPAATAPTRRRWRRRSRSRARHLPDLQSGRPAGEAATGGSQQPWVSSSPIDGSFTSRVRRRIEPVMPAADVATPNAAALATMSPAVAHRAQRAIAIVTGMHPPTADFCARSRSTSELITTGNQPLATRSSRTRRDTSRLAGRSYRLQMETIRASCDESRSSCPGSAAAGIQPSIRRTARQSSGTASFEYGIRFGADGGRIFYEDKERSLSAQK